MRADALLGRMWCLLLRRSLPLMLLAAVLTALARWPAHVRPHLSQALKDDLLAAVAAAYDDGTASDAVIAGLADTMRELGVLPLAPDARGSNELDIDALFVESLAAASDDGALAASAGELDALLLSAGSSRTRESGQAMHDTVGEVAP